MVVVQEGAVRFEAGSSQGPHGPGTRESGFYNRAMVYSRDLTVAVLSAARPLLRSQTPRVMDGLCGTGVRGIRLAKEAGPVELFLNDIDPVTAGMAEANAKANGVEAKVTALPFYKAVAQGPFDYVDIDPYGTPSPFLASLVPSVRRRALLGLCATDTATLVGNHPKALARRYMVDAPFPEPDHEAGLRALVGWAVRICASSDIGFTPLASYHRDHHYRFIALLEQGALRSDRTLKNIGRISWTGTGYRFDPAGKFGPVWTGPLGDAEFIKTLPVAETMACGAELSKDAECWAREWAINSFHVDSAKLSSKMHLTMPPVKRLLAAFESAGHRASRSSLSRDGFVTDAPPDEIASIFRSASQDVGNH